MRLYTNQALAVTEAAAVSFKMDNGSSNNMLVVNGVTGGATITLLVNNEDAGVFVPVLDPFGSQIAVFADILGAMMIDPTQSPYAKVVISGVTGTTDLTIDYGRP